MIRFVCMQLSNCLWANIWSITSYSSKGQHYNFDSFSDAIPSTFKESQWQLNHIIVERFKTEMRNADVHIRKPLHPGLNS